ncbi:MAG TPA: pseudouridine synthase [Syntrophomonas sp.]|nr:pseudouridine synthase [Syntrophomonas sp.]HRW11590.1 pseudouridine synthase [Syntrophomonas sp.]
MRLAKYLAQAGIASRRHAEQMIKNGEIKVNGQQVTAMGIQVEPGRDRVEYRGQMVNNCLPRLVYVLLNKPAGFICSVEDPQGRPTVLNLLGDMEARIYPVGRLDYDTSGLLLLSNDGEFANLIMHPRYKMIKTYEALVKGQVSALKLQKMRQGLLLEDGLTAPAQVKLLYEGGDCLLEISIHEGRKRQIKRMCAAIGHPVISLKRTGLAFLSLHGVEEGHYRLLTDQEVVALKDCARGTDGYEREGDETDGHQDQTEV